MNALLQALTGIPAFTAYVEKIWKHMKLDTEDSDSLVVFMLIKTLLDLKDRLAESSDNAQELHKLLCNVENELDAQTFSKLFE